MLESLDFARSWSLSLAVRSRRSRRLESICWRGRCGPRQTLYCIRVPSEHYLHTSGMYLKLAPLAPLLAEPSTLFRPTDSHPLNMVGLLNVTCRCRVNTHAPISGGDTVVIRRSMCFSPQASRATPADTLRLVSVANH